MSSIRVQLSAHFNNSDSMLQIINCNLNLPEDIYQKIIKRVKEYKPYDIDSYIIISYDNKNREMIMFAVWDPVNNYIRIGRTVYIPKWFVPFIQDMRRYTPCLFRRNNLLNHLPRRRAQETISHSLFPKLQCFNSQFTIEHEKRYIEVLRYHNFDVALIVVPLSKNTVG